MAENSMIIIGAGFAGLSAGVYARMNGYQTTIYEMHDLPGGLCTAWKREGYTIDGCIHWLVGSSPKSGMHRYWQEVGIAQDREFINLDEYGRYECADGRTIILYNNIDRLEQHLLEFSPQDAGAIQEMVAGIRLCTAFDQPSESDPWLKRTVKNARLLWLMATKGKQFQDWMQGQVAVPSPWKPQHIAGGYGHIRYRMFGAAPSHGPRGTTVEVERA